MKPSSNERRDDCVVDRRCIRLKWWLKYSADPGWVYANYSDVGIQNLDFPAIYRLSKAKRVNPSFVRGIESTVVSPSIADGVEVPDLTEDKRLWGINWQQSFSYAIDLSNQIQVTVPLVVQSKEYTFTTQTGELYTPPTGYEALFHSR